MTVPVEVPAQVAAAWGWDLPALAPLAGGLINATYAVRDGERPVAVLQRLHPVFGAAVNLDLEAVTGHLTRKGLATPRLLRTLAGDAWVEHADRVWRALTWVDGVAVQRVPDPAWAEAGGELVGRFHVAVADLAHTYAFARAGVHDTDAHLARLRALVEAGERGGGSGAGGGAAGGGAGAGGEPAERAARGERADPDHVALGREVLAAAAALPAMPPSPRRHCHGDLKISNLLFAAPGDAAPRGVCLVDLDTLGLSTLAFELGDAMRSWCNPRGEDAGAVAFDLAIFEAAMRGFRRVAGAVVAPEEWRAIVVGVETVCLELAARFAVDVFRDEYFGWDSARFASRRAHNAVRARGQLALGLAVRAVRGEALALAERGS